MNIIDIHAHLLWDIDDGIDLKEDTLKIINDINVSYVCTPHFKDIKSIENRFNELKQLYANTYLGSEIKLNSDTLELIQNKKVISMNHSDYLLIEFNVHRSYDHEIDDMLDMLYEVSLCGYKIIIAHVERYFDKKEKLIEAIIKFRNNGYAIQVNTSYIFHSKTIFELLDLNYIDFIASDGHSIEGKRTFNIQECYDYLCKYYDKHNLDIIFKENPALMLANKDIKHTRFKTNMINKLRRFI